MGKKRKKQKEPTHQFFLLKRKENQMTLNLKPVWPVCPFTYQAASSACWPCSAGKGQSATHGLSVSPVAADRAGRVGNVCHSPADGPSLQCWPDQQWSLVLQTEPGTTSPVGFLPQSWDTGPEHPGRPVWKCAAGTRLIWCIWLHCQFKKKKNFNETCLQYVVTSDEALCAEGVNQSACMFLIFIWTIEWADYDLVQHLWQEVFGGLHLFHSTHCIVNIFVV